MKQKDITENRFFLFLAHFLFPPFATWLLAENNTNEFKGQFEEKIYRGTFWGVSLGFLLGLLLVTALVLIYLSPGGLGLLTVVFGAYLPFLLTYSIPILIAIPWLFSIIGRGLGFVYGVSQTLTGAAYPWRVFGSALKVAFTGDAFTRGPGFYRCFFEVSREAGFFGWDEQSSLSPHYMIEDQLCNEIAAQALALLLQHGLLTEANKQFVLTNQYGDREGFNDAISKIFSYYLTATSAKSADFFLALSLPFAPVEMKDSESKKLLADEAEQKESEQNKQLTLRDKIEEERHTVQRSHGGLSALEHHRQASRATQAFLFQYFEEVKRQIGLLVEQNIDPKDYLKWIIKNPWDTGLLIDRLVDLKSKFPAHFQEYNKLVQDCMSDYPNAKIIVFSRFVLAFLNLEQALVDRQLEEVDRVLVLNQRLLSLAINEQLKCVIKLRQQGRLSPENRPYIEKYSHDYLWDFSMLDLPRDLEERTPTLVKEGEPLQLGDEKTSEPSPPPETKALPQAQKEIVFMSAYIGEKQKYEKSFSDELTSMVGSINQLNTTPEGRQAWNEYCEKSKTDPFYFDRFLIQSLALLYQRGQGLYANKLLSDIKKRSEAPELKTEYLTEAQGALFAFVLAVVGNPKPVDDSAVEREYNRVLSQFGEKILKYKEWREIEEVISVLELMEQLHFLAPSVATEVREKNVTRLLDNLAATFQVLEILKPLLERGVIAPEEAQRYFDRMYRYVTEGRDVAGLLKVLIKLDKESGTVLNRETLDAVLAYQNRPYTNELKTLFELKTNSGGIFKRIPLSEENKQTGVHEKKRGSIIRQIISKGDHTAILHNHLNGNLVTGLVLESSIMGRLKEALPPGHKSPAPTPSEAEGAVNILRLEAEMIRQPDKDPRLKSVEKKGSETKFEEEKISSATEIKGRDENEVLHLYAAHPHYDSNPWGQVQHFLSPLQAQPPAAARKKEGDNQDEDQVNTEPDPNKELKRK